MPQKRNMGNFDRNMIPIVVLSVCGQDEGAPNEVDDQSKFLISSLISPPFARNNSLVGRFFSIERFRLLRLYYQTNVKGNGFYDWKNHTEFVTFTSLFEVLYLINQSFLYKRFDCSPTCTLLLVIDLVDHFSSTDSPIITPKSPSVCIQFCSGK